jgi:hypothetical protein
MQAVRSSVVACLLLSVALGSAAVAAPRQEEGKETPRKVRRSEKPPNPWIGGIVTLLDDLQGWLSIPPG